MSDPKRRNARFAFTPTESRALWVLAVLLFVGIAAGQIRRSLRPNDTQVVVEGARQVDPDSLIALNETASNDSLSMAKGRSGGVISTPKDELGAESVTRQESGVEKVAAGGEKLDVNSASLEQLQTLPGIGPVLAGRIIEFRKENGGFVRLEDLLLVRGIGEKRLEKLSPLVTVEQTHTKGEFR